MNITVSYKEYLRNIKSLNKILIRLNMNYYCAIPMSKKVFEEMRNGQA